MDGSFEQQLRREKYDVVIGIDEAGRGPLAGPVVSAAVCLTQEIPSGLVNDSKKLSASKREKAFDVICQSAFVGVGVIDEKIIDQINILEATFLSMNKAVEALMSKMAAVGSKAKKICLLVDGNRFKSQYPYDVQTIVQGDALVLSIACASIIAKVTRDRMMLEYDKQYPQYGFAIHKGYPTKAHKDAVRQFGFSPIHRRTFNPDFAIAKSASCGI